MERANGDMALWIHLEELSHLRQVIAKLKRAILAPSRPKQYPPWVYLLRTILGISTLTAMILLTELGEIKRLRAGKAEPFTVDLEQSNCNDFVCLLSRNITQPMTPGIPKPRKESHPERAEDQWVRIFRRL